MEELLSFFLSEDTKVTDKTTNLTFPFMPTSDAHVAFPSIPPKYMEKVLAACPKEFFEKRHPIVAQLIVNGWTEDRQKWAMEHFITQNAEVARNQIKCIQMWAGSFQIRHEQKEAIVAWLFSVAFTEMPPRKW